MREPPSEVQGYLDTLPDQSRAALLALRETVGSSAPDLEERIGYGVPAFYYDKRPLVSYGATKNHCALYVQSPAVVDMHRADLEGYDLSKGTVRFQPEHPLPAVLVKALVQARIAEIEAQSRGS